MARIKGFECYLVKSDHAAYIVSPACDWLSPEKRRLFLDKHPDNFLNTMRSMEDLELERKLSTTEELLQSNKSCLNRLINDGFFEKIDQPCMYIYELASGNHTQIGIVCAVSVEEYEMNQLRKHENTCVSKEDLLTHYQTVLGVDSSPICLAYGRNRVIDKLISEYIQQPANLEFISEDGVLQKIWCIYDKDRQTTLSRAFLKIETTYLTDGHHRAESGRRYAEIMRKKKGNRGDEPYNQLLVILFPDNQLNLLPFHRCVKDTNGLSEFELIEKISENFEVKVLDISGSREELYHKPTDNGQFGMFAFNKWFNLKIKKGKIDENDLVLSLDVSILQNLILIPILGITDTRIDSRLDYVTDSTLNEGIKKKHSEGWQITFTCHAASIDQLMNVADMDGLMPPKSTYFNPKPRSGIFVRLK